MLTQPFARTNSYLYSFIPNSISHWNCLPVPIVSQCCFREFKCYLHTVQSFVLYSFYCSVESLLGTQLLAYAIFCTHASAKVSQKEKKKHHFSLEHFPTLLSFRSMLHPLLAIMCPYPTLCYICIFSHGVHTLITCIPGSYPLHFCKNCYRKKKISVGKNFHVDQS